MKVRLISKQRQAALIEWWSEEDDNYFRSVVPLNSLQGEGDGLQCDMAEQGIPQGVPWSEISIDRMFNPHVLEKELRRVGVWSYEDINNNPQAVVNALQKAMGIGLQEVKSFAKNYGGKV